MSLVSGSPISLFRTCKNLLSIPPVGPTPEDLELSPQTYEPAVKASDMAGERFGQGSGGRAHPDGDGSKAEL